jgi:ankyrin repeat protein
MKKIGGLILWTVLVVPVFAADLHEAAKAGDLQKVRSLVKASPDAVNLKDGSGRTPLHWAARNDHLGVVEFLLNCRSDVQAVDNLGYTALYYSVWLGRNSKIAERLISRGSDVNFNKGGVPLLFLASREGKEEIAAMLIAHGAKMSVPDIVGKTPLHISVEGKSQNIVELLLDNGASLSVRDKLGRTPLHQSAIEGYLKISELLLAAGAPVNEKDDAGETPLDYARKHGNETVARLLKSKGGTAGEQTEQFGYSPWLRKKLPADEAVIWYLGHAGWAVKTRNTFLVFDYWERGKSEQPLLSNGRINPEEIKDLDVYVFSSHAHDDHYDKVIFDWENTVDRIAYVFGWLNEKGKNFVCLSPICFQSFSPT